MTTTEVPIHIHSKTDFASFQIPTFPATEKAETHAQHIHAYVDHPSHEQQQRRGRIGRLLDCRNQRRVESRQKKIFNQALTLTTNHDHATEHRHHEHDLSSEMRDIIIETARRTGKEDILLDPNLADSQLEAFSQTFSSLYNSQNKDKPVISKTKKIVTLGGQAVIAGVEIASGNWTTPSVLNVGVHDGADTLLYREQLNNTNNPESEKANNNKRRKVVYAVTAGISAFAATKGLTDGVTEIVGDQQDVTTHPAALYSAAASLGLVSAIAGLSYRRLRREIQNGNQHAGDLLKHFATDAFSSALGVAGAYAQKHGVNLVESLAAIFGGGVQAWYFRPTRRNLAKKHDHSHLEDDHHHSHTHDHTESHEPKETKLKIKPQAGRFKKAVAALATATVLASGGIGAKVLSDSQEAGNPRPDKVTTAPVLPVPPTEQVQPEQPKADAPQLTKTVCASKGDNMWKMVQDAIRDTGLKPTVPLTNALVTMTAEKNITTLPEPDSINVGQCAELPNDKVITVVFDALSQPNDLTADLQTVNDQPDTTKKEVVAKQGSKIKNIWNKVRSKI